MRSLLFRPGQNRRDELIAELWDAGTVGIIEEDDDSVRAFFDDTKWPPAGLNFYAEQETQEPGKAAFPPPTPDWDGICAGKHFFIAPSWVRASAPEGRIRITLDSGAAFGTGRHETTQLMIERLEDLIKGGETVVDVGCGSGLLGEVSRLLGAGLVIGCDIDPIAIDAARTFEAPVFLGSADAVASECADILLVNISAKVIDALAAELKRVAKRKGLVVLAGFVSGNTPQCVHPTSVSENNDWLCWTGSREDIVPHANPSSIVTHPMQWW